VTGTTPNYAIPVRNYSGKGGMVVAKTKKNNIFHIGTILS